MRRIFAILAFGLILGPISAGEAQAQIDDHLKCYKIKDDIKLKGLVDLNSLQFGLEAGCKISKAKMFCIPATKSNVQVQAKNNDGPVDPLPISGPPAPGDRICYKIKCPDPQPPNTTASDQFGTHNMSKLKAFMLCTPAGKFTPPPTPCDLSGYPTCGGECPDPNSQTCHPANDGTPQCLCDEPCGFDSQGVCGGDCAVATDVCQLSVTSGKCDCGPATAQCTDTFFPQCAGPCPQDEVCIVVQGTDNCKCQPDPDVCHFDLLQGTCGGPCPTPGDTCVEVQPGFCDCQPSQQQLCEDFPSGQQMCGGPCPNNFACDDDPQGTNCKCYPQFDCGDPQLDPQCDGACQVGETCVLDPALGCRCI